MTTVETVFALMTPGDLAVLWPWVTERLDDAPEVWNKRWTSEALFKLASEDLMQCWVLFQHKPQLVVFTQIIQYPVCGVLQVFLASGSGLLENLDLIKHTLEAFALANECKVVEIPGRGGWTRTLGRYGYQVQNTVVARNLTDELRKQ